MLSASESSGGCAASSSSSSGAAVGAEQSNPCPVCLEPINEEAYLDQCFHAFCYSCIAQWTRIVSSKHSHPLSSIKCPLCKTENSSILHSLRHNYFKRHYVKHGPENSQTSFPSRGHVFRRQCYDSDPGILHKKFNVQIYWKYHRYLKQNKWLEQWLRREIQTLAVVEDVDVVVHHILGVIEDFLKRAFHDLYKKGCWRCKLHQILKLQPREFFRGTYEQKREEFKTLICDAAKPFISEWTKRFVDELELFLISGLNLEAYDKLYVEAMSTSRLTSTFTEEVSNSQVSLLYVHDEEVDHND